MPLTVLQPHAAMSSGDCRATLERIRDLIERVIIHPAAAAGAYEIELIGIHPVSTALPTSGEL